jgi:hypothetical protein
MVAEDVNYLLLQHADVSAPELSVRQRFLVAEELQAPDVDLQRLFMASDLVLRQVHGERTAEVRCRGIDDGEVGGGGRRRIGGVDDPYSQGRNAARLQREPFVLVRDGRQADAEASAHAVGRLFLLHRQ